MRQRDKDAREWRTASGAIRCNLEGCGGMTCVEVLLPSHQKKVEGILGTPQGKEASVAVGRIGLYSTVSGLGNQIVV